MLKTGGTVHLSASDLVGHLNCRYLTSLDLAVAKGVLAKPFIWDDPVLEVLAERGALHEQGYVDHLKANGLSVTPMDGVGVDSSVVAQTLDAMKAGAPIIVQCCAARSTGGTPSAPYQRGWFQRAPAATGARIISALSLG